jgi:hypothetical protein
MIRAKRHTKKPNKSFDRIGIERAMHMWGIDRNKNEDHKAFWKDMVEYIHDTEQGNFDPEPANCPSKLPTDPLEALQEVFLQELEGMLKDSEEGFLQVADSLKERYENVPFRPPFRYDRQLSRRYQLHPDYQALGVEDLADLDSLERFQFHRRPAIDVLTEQVNDNNMALSMGLRAIVAHKACLDADCANCGNPEIYWNDYHGDDEAIRFRYWKKLVCSHCDSVYEIKYSKNVEFMRTCFAGGFKDGGSFYASYHSIRADLPIGAKQYLVMISAKRTTTSTQEYWPVYAVEIKSIRPILKDKSFDKDANRCKVYSRIELRIGTEKHWFDAPCFEFDGQSIALDILEKLRA